MRPALRRDLSYTGIFDSELFAKQGTLFLELVVFCSESYSRIDAVGSPGSSIDNRVVGQGNRIKHRRLNAALPAPGKMDLRRLRHGEHGGLRKRVLESFWLQDTVKAIDSTAYGLNGEPKESVDQDTPT
jgi:hypothetical protein